MSFGPTSMAGALLVDESGSDMAMVVAFMMTCGFVLFKPEHLI
jgi:hypothetical protein